MEEQGMVTVSQAARLLSVSTKTFRWWDVKLKPLRGNARQLRCRGSLDNASPRHLREHACRPRPFRAPGLHKPAVSARLSRRASRERLGAVVHAQGGGNTAHAPSGRQFVSCHKGAGRQRRTAYIRGRLRHPSTTSRPPPVEGNHRRNTASGYRFFGLSDSSRWRSCSITTSSTIARSPKLLGIQV